MGKVKREKYATTLNPDHIKKLKLIALAIDKKDNEALEEAIELLSKKYQNKLKSLLD